MDIFCGKTNPLPGYQLVTAKRNCEVNAIMSDGFKVEKENQDSMISQFQQEVRRIPL